MSDYFNERDGTRARTPLNEQALPVRTKEGIDWELLSSPNRYRKKFKFKKRQQLLNFIADLMQYEDEVQHHAEIMIRYKTVTLTVWTHTLDDITDMDREYVRMTNEIYKDNNASTDE